MLWDRREVSEAIGSVRVYISRARACRDCHLGLGLAGTAIPGVATSFSLACNFNQFCITFSLWPVEARS
jgi:hypothetical protein